MNELACFADFEALLASFTNYERQRSFAYSSRTLNLERMRRLAAGLGHPQQRYPIVHIAGTKGKGSTTLILEALLEAHGLRTGAYTSPHVEDICERIRVGRRNIAPDDLVTLANRLLPHLQEMLAAPPDEHPTFFEVMTALALLHFSEQRVDWAILEVGLGGRLDATNIVEPRLTAVTSIGLEHTQLLGDSLASIAAEKGGIIKEGVPLVCGDLPLEAARVIGRIARERRAPTREVSPQMVNRLPDGRLTVQSVPAPLDPGAIRGPALRADLAIGLCLAQAVLESHGLPFSPDAVAAGLRHLELPARVEFFPTAPPAVVDGAHTAESLRALGEALEEARFPRPRLAIVSFAKDKILAPLFAQLEGVAEEVLFTRAHPLRSWEATELQSRFGRGEIEEDPHLAFEKAHRRGQPLVITGSFYLAGPLRRLLRNRRLVTQD